MKTREPSTLVRAAYSTMQLMMWKLLHQCGYNSKGIPKKNTPYLEKHRGMLSCLRSSDAGGPGMRSPRVAWLASSWSSCKDARDLVGA